MINVSGDLILSNLSELQAHILLRTTDATIFTKDSKQEAAVLRTVCLINS